MNTTEYAVISPVWGWHLHEEMLLPGNVRIEMIGELDKISIKGWSEALNGEQIRALSNADFWFRYDFKSSGEPEAERNAKELVRNTILACQVVFPTGSHDSGSFLCVCEKHRETLVICSFSLNRRLQTASWALTPFPPIDKQELVTVVEGVQEAFRKEVARLVNPLCLLELGEEANNSHMRLLQWVTGLDALLIAEGRYDFERNLSNLLGRRTYVFPPIDGVQPKYQVGDVALDLYKLRDKIAHGLAIPKEFREITGFEDVGGKLIDGMYRYCQYRHVLEEAALFLLCSALKTVFTRNLTEVVADLSTWREYLMSPQPVT
ncbi:MAG: hypothetical protein P8Z30_01890 [Acidobacteriota bacterium]